MIKNGSISDQLTALIFAVASVLSALTTAYLMYGVKNSKEQRTENEEQKKMLYSKSVYIFKIVGLVCKFIWPTFLIFLSSYLLTTENYVLFGITFSVIILYYILSIWIMEKRNNDKDSFKSISDANDKVSMLLFYYWISKKEKKYFKRFLWAVCLLSMMFSIILFGFVVQNYHFFLLFIVMSVFISILQIAIFLLAYKNEGVFEKAVKNDLEKRFPEERKNIFSIYCNTGIKEWKRKVDLNISEKHKEEFESFFDKSENKEYKIVIGLLTKDEMDFNNLLLTPRIKKMTKTLTGKENTKKQKILFSSFSYFKRRLKSHIKLNKKQIELNQEQIELKQEQIELKQEQIEFKKILNHCKKLSTSSIQNILKEVKNMKLKHNIEDAAKKYICLLDEILEKNKPSYFNIKKYLENYFKIKKIKKIKKYLEEISDEHNFKKSKKILQKASSAISSNYDLSSKGNCNDFKINHSLTMLYISKSAFISNSEKMPHKYMNYVKTKTQRSIKIYSIREKIIFIG